MKRAEKGAVVEEIKTLLAGAKVAMLADYRGLTVSELTELRKLLRQQGVALRVVKNTLAKRATSGTELQGIEQHLSGPTAVIFGKGDPTVSAKLLASYARTKPNFQVKGGYFEGRVVAREDALALADLPPRDVLMARLAGIVQSPLRGLVISLHAPLRSLLAALEAVGRKKAQETPGA